MRRSVAPLVAALVVAVASVAGAATVRQLSLKDLAALAQVVAQGEVAAVEPQWVQGRIFRKVTLTASRVLKGPLKAGQPVAFWVPGGEVGHLGQWVPGAPEFEVGERTLLFLEPRPIGYVVVGMALGKLRTETDERGETWAIRDPHDDLGAGPLQVTWQRLEATVRASR